MSARCRSCAAPLLWAATENGRRIPLDPDPYMGDDPRGLFVLRGKIAIATTPDAFAGEPVYRSHFATCPNAKEHRR